MFTINFSDSKFKNNYVKKIFNTKRSTRNIAYWMIGKITLL